MALLMEALESKIKPSKEARGSNLEIGSEGKPRDNEGMENELRK
jgi:hypothetical protein